MNKQVYIKIAKDEGVTILEAKEMWEDELADNGNNIEEALFTFGMEPDYPFFVGINAS